MALPPKGDPRRPLVLAIRSTRLLGIIFLAFGAISLLPLALGLGRGRGGNWAMTLFMIIGCLFYFVPGIGYIVCSMFLTRRQPWAIITALVLASINLLLVLFGLLGLVVAMASDNSGMPFILIPLAIVLIFVLALVQLIYHLSRSFESLRHPPDGIHGFEPIRAQPVLPQSQDQPEL